LLRSTDAQERLNQEARRRQHVKNVSPENSRTSPAGARKISCIRDWDGTHVQITLEKPGNEDEAE
jgi:hypothetical protein